MQPPHALRRWPALASLAVAAALTLDPGQAARPRERAGAATHPPFVRPGAAGRIVALDPETGRLGAASPDQMRDLRATAGVASVSRSEEGLVETRLTDGTVILDLNGRFQDYMVARLDRNGRLTYGCVHDGGQRLASPDSIPATALEEK
jgi:hypothetical protein